jgi:poly-gamma-glutamate capsule biosynthesis protein CapA/YwtB (metallophosphatase superfamily)
MYFSLFWLRWWRWIIIFGVLIGLIGYYLRIEGKKTELLDFKGGLEGVVELSKVGFPDYNTGVVVENNPIRLMVVGDVMLGRMVGVRMAEKKDYLYPFREVLNEVEAADLVMINLESPIFEPCPLVRTGMKFCADKRVLVGLSEFGVRVAGIANNHIRNYGKEGYLMTLDKLREGKIEPSDEENLAVMEIEGVKFGFWAIDLVSASYKDEWLVEKVNKMERQVDVLVVSVHWGAEYKNIESEIQRHWGRLLVDGGADLVVGHHPHVIQRVEVYQGVPIVYSLGNFVFDQLWSTETREGVMGGFVFNKRKLTEMTFEPIFINDNYQPVLVVDQGKRERILSRLGNYAL